MSISEKTLDLVRQRTDLVALVNETVKLARRGRTWVGLCPFHKEKTPSFHVTPERGFFHCFGCSEHGNAFSFLMNTEGLSFPEAVRKLAERAGIAIEESATEQERREEASVRKARDDLYAVSNLAAFYFETMLRQHPQASFGQDELAKRGLVDGSPTGPIASALQAFRIGYAPAGWDGLTAFLREQGVSPAVAERVGLLVGRPSGTGYYDRFRHRLMFPIFDIQGRVIAFSGRALPDPTTGQVEKEAAKYINSPESPIYRKGETIFGLFQARRAIRDTQEAVLVEGNFDVLSLHAHGIGHVVAPLGTALTAAQASLLKRFTPTVVLMLDSDEAGRKATRAAREPCKQAGLVTKAALLPTGKDPDELVRQKGPQALWAALRASRDLLEYLINECLDEPFARADAEERAARVREVSNLLRSEDDPTVRAMAHKLADDVARRLALQNPRLGLVDVDTFNALAREVVSAIRRPPIPTGLHGSHLSSAGQATNHPQGQTSMGHGERGSAGGQVLRRADDPVTEAVLGCLFDFPELLEDPEVVEALGFLNGEAVFVVAELQKLGSDHFLGLDADEFLAHLPPSFHAFARYRFVAPVHQDPQTARMELLANADKLKRRTLSRENALVGEEARRAEAMGDDLEAVALLREVQERARKKRGMA